MKLARYRHAFGAMGCPCEVDLYAPSQTSAQRAFAIATEEIRRLDCKYSHYRDDSWLAEFQQRAASPAGADADVETAALLEFAESLFEMSGGAFDITTRPLTRLWDGVDRIPSREQIEGARAACGWERISWDGRRLRIPAGMTLDFGGVVKEYAADRVAGILRQVGFGHGYVDLGGDFHFLGPHLDGSPWQVGIRNPSCRTAAIATVAIRQGGLASSGDYERYVEIDGQRFSHLLDARTGWPVDTNDADALSSVSATAPSCLVAGSVATLAMLIQGERARSFLEDSGLSWIAVARDAGVAGTLETTG